MKYLLPFQIKNWLTCNCFGNLLGKNMTIDFWTSVNCIQKFVANQSGIKGKEDNGRQSYTNLNHINGFTIVLYNLWTFISFFYYRQIHKSSWYDMQHQNEFAISFDFIWLLETKTVLCPGKKSNLGKNPGNNSVSS